MASKPAKAYPTLCRCSPASFSSRGTGPSSECGFCDHSNPPSSKYCNECGSPLNFKPCAECGAVNETSALGCYKCGAKLPDQNTRVEARGDTAPTANVRSPATSHRGLAQERKELHRTDSFGSSPEGDVSRAIEASLDVLVRESHFSVPCYQSPANDAT